MMVGFTATLSVVCCFTFYLPFSVNGIYLPEWTWIGGSSHIDQLSSNSSNHTSPGARNGPTGWIDIHGDLWLFGGKGKGFKKSRRSTPYNVLNDLWRFNIASKSWNLIHSNIEEDSKEIPPPLTQSVSCSYLNNAVLFGGKYSDDTLSSSTWILDIDSGRWSLLNITAITHYPGPRESPSVWCNADKMWVFGGRNNTHEYNDMWNFSFINRQWQKQDIKGKSPSTRKGALTWFVPDYKKLYLFGGWSNQKYLSDLWVYSLSENEWSQLQNSSSDSAGSYGTVGVFCSMCRPGGRFASATWTDLIGNLWLFGGYGYYSFEDSLKDGYLSDLWMLDTNKSVWVWMGGEQVGEKSPHYPSKPGQRKPTNLPGPRSNTVSYTSGGEFYLFGGEGHGYGGENGEDGMLNDLWQLHIPLVLEEAVKPPPLRGNTLELSLMTRIAISVSVLFAGIAFTLLVCYRWDNRRNKLMGKNIGPRVRYERVSESIQEIDTHTAA